MSLAILASIKLAFKHDSLPNAWINQSEKRINIGNIWFETSEHGYNQQWSYRTFISTFIRSEIERRTLNVNTVLSNRKNRKIKSTLVHRNVPYHLISFSILLSHLLYFFYIVFECFTINGKIQTESSRWVTKWTELIISITKSLLNHSYYNRPKCAHNEINLIDFSLFKFQRMFFCALFPFDESLVLTGLELF